MLNSTFTKLALAGTVSLLVACGGGGGGSKPKSSSSAATTSSSSASVVSSVSSSIQESSSSSDTTNPGGSSSSDTTNPGTSSSDAPTSSSSSDNNPGTSSSSSDGGVIVTPSSSSSSEAPVSSSSSETPVSSSSSSEAPVSSSSSSEAPVSSSSSSEAPVSSSSSSEAPVSSSSSSEAPASSSSSSEAPASSSSSSEAPVSSSSSSEAPVSSSSSSEAPVSSSSSDSNTSSSSSSSVDQGAVDIVDDTKYDGDISLDETKVIGTPGAALQTTGNPFADSYFYLSPDIKTMMDSSITLVENDSSLGSAEKAELINKIKFVQRQPSAVWMDSIATIAGNGVDRRSLIGHLDAAVAQQKYYEQKDGNISPMTIVIIIYNLPDRDCAAFASNGQLYEIGKPFNWTGEKNGLQKYRDEYLKVITDAFTAKPEYKNLRIVAMLEPDSYPNMITNTKLNPDGPSLIWPELTTTGVKKTHADPGETYCDTLLTYTEPGLEEGLGVYGRGLQIAIEELYKVGTAGGTQNNIYTYLDIGHAGWLGWDDAMNQQSNLKRGVEGFLKLIRGAGDSYEPNGFKKVRGFASNTSGYTPTEEPLISNAETDREVLKDFYEWNKAVDEVSYIDAFHARIKSQEPSFNPGFIIDTARNGWGGTDAGGNPRPVVTPQKGDHGTGTDLSKRVDKRNHRGHWCNVDEAGVGEVPKPNPDSARPYLDTFFWMKPPGESDGISFDVANYAKNSANWIALDDIDKAIVEDASHERYFGKQLDTMCIPGSIRDGDKATKPVPALAPHAGGWFHKQFIMLINNAHPELGKSEY